MSWVDCTIEDTSDDNLQAVLFYSSFAVLFKLNLFSSVKASLEMYILMSAESIFQLCILHSTCADNQGNFLCDSKYIFLLWQLFIFDKRLRSETLFHLMANLSITFKAFSPHSSKIMILIFLCLLAGMICCCYDSFDQSALASKVAAAQDITSLCCWWYFLSKSYCPCNTINWRDYNPHLSRFSSQSGMLNCYSYDCIQGRPQRGHTFLFAEKDGKRQSCLEDEKLQVAGEQYCLTSLSVCAHRIRVKKS